MQRIGMSTSSRLPSSNPRPIGCREERAGSCLGELCGGGHTSAVNAQDIPGSTSKMPKKAGRLKTKNRISAATFMVTTETIAYAVLRTATTLGSFGTCRDRFGVKLFAETSCPRCRFDESKFRRARIPCLPRRRTSTTAQNRCRKDKGFRRPTTSLVIPSR